MDLKLFIWNPRKKYWILNSFLIAETVPISCTITFMCIDLQIRTSEKILMYVKNLFTHHTNGGSDEYAPIIMNKLLMNNYHCHVISCVIIWILYIAINNFIKPYWFLFNPDLIRRLSQTLAKHIIYTFACMLRLNPHLLIPLELTDYLLHDYLTSGCVETIDDSQRTEKHVAHKNEIKENFGINLLCIDSASLWILFALIANSL